jgi:PPOX class probable F420-dependent enzyme
MGEKLSGKWAVYVALEKIGRISTIDEDGMPHTTPVFYAMLDGEVYFGTQSPRRKFRNIERNPKVCFCIDTPESPYKGITIQGNAVVVDDAKTHEKFREALMHRYYGHPDSPGWQYIQSLGQSALVRIDATKVMTWDFSGE